jgi:hypothetical protein
VYCHIEISQFVAPLIYVCTSNELISILVHTLILESLEFRSNMQNFPPCAQRIHLPSVGGLLRIPSEEQILLPSFLFLWYLSTKIA